MEILFNRPPKRQYRSIAFTPRKSEQVFGLSSVRDWYQIMRHKREQCRHKASYVEWSLDKKRSLFFIKTRKSDWDRLLRDDIRWRGRISLHLKGKYSYLQGMEERRVNIVEKGKLRFMRKEKMQKWQRYIQNIWIHTFTHILRKDAVINQAFEKKAVLNIF